MAAIVTNESLFNRIDALFEGAEAVARAVTDDETLHVAYRDGDLHLYVTRLDDETLKPGMGNAFTLSVLNTKISTLNEDRVVFDGFAVAADPRQPYQRATVTLRRIRTGPTGT